MCTSFLEFLRLSRFAILITQRNRGGKRGGTGAKNYGKGGKRKPKKNNRGSQSTEISRKPERHHGRSKSSGKQSGGVEQ
jgi:hypothetical protein